MSRLFSVTRRVYRDLTAPPPMVDAHRRRQLDALLEQTAVTDHRPSPGPARPPAGARRHIPGEALL